MLKLISAIFTAGVVVGIALVVRQRRLGGTTEQSATTLDHSNSDSNADRATEPQEPIAVPAERR